MIIHTTWVSTPRMTFCFTAHYGYDAQGRFWSRIVEVAPIAQWAHGKRIAVLMRWLRRQCGGAMPQLATLDKRTGEEDA